MAFMAPAPDQASTYGAGGLLSRSLSTPASYRSTAVSPTDSMSSLSSFEKLMETGTTTTGTGRNGGGVAGGHSGCSAPGAFSSRSATTTSTGSYWGQEMVQMLQAGGGAELPGSGMVSSDWQQLLDTKSAPGSYKYMTPVSMAPSPSPSRGGIMENARIREMMAGRAGKPTTGWGAADVVTAGGIKVDPTKGGLALQPGVGLATSHCLAQFTSDPAFAERAAKFSSFGNGKYPQIALPLPVNDAGKPRSRSAESGGRLSRTSSSQNSAKKQVAGAESMESTTKAAAAASATAAAAAAAGAAAAAAAERSCDMMDVDNNTGVMRSNTSIDDCKKSPPGAARVLQPELEAIEGASLAAMVDDTTTHELVEAPAAREPTNSCSVEQPPPPPTASVQRGGGYGSNSPAASPARSPSGSDDSDRRKRKNSPDCKPDVDPKVRNLTVPHIHATQNLVNSLLLPFPQA